MDNDARMNTLGGTSFDPDPQQPSVMSMPGSVGMGAGMGMPVYTM